MSNRTFAGIAALAAVSYATAFEAQQRTHFSGVCDGTTAAADADDEAAAAQEAAEAAAAAAAAQGGNRSGRSVTLPSDQIGQLKRKARDQGRRAGLLEYAKGLGFSSVEEMQEAHKKPARSDRTQRQPTGGTQQPAATESAELRKLRRENEQLKETNQRLARDKATAETRYRNYRRQLEAVQQENEVALRLVQAGVAADDTEIGISLVKRALSGKSASDIANFDLDTFVEDLRTKRPALFVQPEVQQTQVPEKRPAQTTPAKDQTQQTTQRPQAPQRPAPARPAPKAPAAAPDSTPKFDALKATPDEVDAELRKRGLGSMPRGG